MKSTTFFNFLFVIVAIAAILAAKKPLGDIPPHTQQMGIMPTVIYPDSNLDKIITQEIKKAIKEDSLIALGIQPTSIGLDVGGYKRTSWVYKRNPRILTEKDLSFVRDNITNISKIELRDKMITEGFNLPADVTFSDMKRAFIAFHYESLYFRMNELTGLPQSVIFAYHVIESIGAAGETRKHTIGFNFGGIKARPGDPYELYYDDCYDSKGRRIKCKFLALNSFEEGVQAWARVFNAPRYQKTPRDPVPCKSKSSIEKICQCLYERGYHTSKNWQSRAKLARKYWGYRTWFPR